MAAANDYDVAILGGGLAGLSLAVRLAAIPHVRAVVIEARPAYRRDKTWSYWRLLDHPFGEAVAARWLAWEVTRLTGSGRRVVTTQACPAHPYETIPADRLYALARARLASAPHVDLRLGCAVEQVSEEAERVRIETSQGGLTAAFVFDSRPPPARQGRLVQRFLGQEVRVARPVFDADRVTLMDFAVRQQPGLVRFLYVLPISPTQALVEDTWLAPAESILPDHRDAIRAYLAERFGVADFEVTFEEEGAIPMSPDLQAPGSTGRVLPIGTAGGAVKPSSGYGFLAIQRMADALAADLAAGRRPTPFQPRSPAARWMDGIFLSALRHAPEQAPLIFESLFGRARPGPLLRFLNDIGGQADIAKVIAATPKRPMLAAAARQVLGRRGATAGVAAGFEPD